VFVSLIAALLVAVLGSFMVGRYAITPGELLSLLTGGPEAQGMSGLVLFKVRLSRIFGALLIGGALSLSGAVYQGMMKNPMVSPDILGASAGAGLGASLGISLGWEGFAVQVLAFVFGLLAVVATMGMSRLIETSSGGGIMVLVLTGMVFSSLFSALISAVKYTADPYDKLPTITFWLMGGLSYVTVDDVLLLLVPVIAGTVPILLMRWQLNVLSLGDQEANTLGVHAVRLRVVFILCATLLTSSAVAVGGMIGWIGLIIPHLARLLVGVNHNAQIPASLLLGAIFMLIVDDLARTLLPQEIPLSIITAILGTPVFLYLLFARKGNLGM
jgi:iron complex transport system permease protein